MPLKMDIMILSNIRSHKKKGRVQMEKTNKIVTIHSGNSFIEREIYIDEEDYEYVKIYDIYVSISVLKEYYNYNVKNWF